MPKFALAFGLALPILLAAIAPAPAANITASQLAAICGQRARCDLAGTHDAGKAADGEPRLVVELRLSLADKPDDAPDDGCRNDSDRDGGTEYWVFNGKHPPVRLLDLCNDGYGAAGVGEDEVEIEDNRLTHTQHGGSAWRWYSSTAYRLEPLTRLETTDCSFHTGSPGSGTLTYADLWNLRLRSFGFDSGDPAGADEIGCPEEVPLTLSPRPAAGVLSAFALPAFGPGDDTRQMRKIPTGAALLDCALSISTDAANGFLVYGQPAKTDAAEMKVAVDSPSSLVVQIFDPLAKASQYAASWVHQPHVELWRAPSSADTLAGYAHPKTVEQIGIDLSGKPWPGLNAGKLPQIERWVAKDERGRDVVVMRVTWAEDSALSWGIAAVYSQAEQGRQSRLISTTGIERNRPLFLPPARRFDRDCSLQSGFWKASPLPEITATGSRRAVP